MAAPKREDLEERMNGGPSVSAIYLLLADRPSRAQQTADCLLYNSTRSPSPNMQTQYAPAATAGGQSAQHTGPVCLLTRFSQMFGLYRDSLSIPIMNSY